MRYLSSFLAKLANSIEPIDRRVRQRLRELRGERGLTLADVAERADIDISTLSRLESGKRRLALDHIPALASALGVSTDELLGSRPRQDPRVRARSRRIHGMTLWPLTQRGSAGGLHAYKVTISAKRCTPPDPLPVHEGHDWLYVLDGRLRLLLDEAEHIIKPGEAAEFTTWTPHWFGAIDGPVQLIMITGPDGQRVHLHS
ncbi:MAG: transcriptional regulator, family [Solirubrobacterales bacterium]|nr:transcriptional regulator, family [Solirubrobacterales bacterium]